MRRSLAIVLGLMLWAAPPVTAARALAHRPPTARPGAVTVHHYEMTGRIRPLIFFWISRSHVGEATITWRRGPGETGYSLLIGSDPDHAPLRINRWGYIGEDTRGPVTRVIGVMTKSDERSLKQAEANVGHTGRTHVFRVIRASIDGRHSRSAVMTFDTRQDYSIHQADTVLKRIPLQSGKDDVRIVTVPAGVEPGFLTAVADLVRVTVQRSHASTDTRPPAPISYVYHGLLYGLRITRLRRVAALTVGGVTYRHLLAAEFENDNRSNGSRTYFTLRYGTEGALRGIPVTISYEPRWWLKIDLTLADGRAAAGARP